MFATWQPSDELRELAGLDSQLFADASEAAVVDWSAEAAMPEAERRKLTHDPKALPRLLELIAAAQSELRSGTDTTDNDGSELRAWRANEGLTPSGTPVAAQPAATLPVAQEAETQLARRLRAAALAAPASPAVPQVGTWR